MTTALVTPSQNVTMERLEDQIAWYDNGSQRNQKIFKTLKVMTIVSAALIPLTAGIGATPWLTGGLGALIAVLEGLQQLNQYQHQWITYRSTAEALKHEKYLFLAGAGPYADATNAKTVLAERIESLISQEHAKWVTTAEQVPKSGSKS